MFKNRGYKRDKPYTRDCRLFAIACEGSKREPEYFSVFHHLSNRIKVDVIKESETHENFSKNSSPKWVLDRAARYADDYDLKEDDELWLVLDVDDWSFDLIKDLSDHCESRSNWHIAISNPCFEVWLFMHMSDKIDESGASTCKEFKTKISEFDSGGYNCIKFIKNVHLAIERAEQLDDNPEYFFPSEKRTKVYKLLKSMIDFAGQREFNEFINSKLDILLKSKNGK